MKSETQKVTVQRVKRVAEANRSVSYVKTLDHSILSRQQQQHKKENNIRQPSIKKDRPGTSCGMYLRGTISQSHANVHSNRISKLSDPKVDEGTSKRPIKKK